MSDMTTIGDICRDLADEHRSLDGMVSELEAEAWYMPTPSPGWTLRDQIGHLAFFDDEATYRSVEAFSRLQPDVRIPWFWAEGQDAVEAWMTIAQSFSGPPGEGRNPGRFPKPL